MSSAVPRQFTRAPEFASQYTVVPSWGPNAWGPMGQGAGARACFFSPIQIPAFLLFLPLLYPVGSVLSNACFL